MPGQRQTFRVILRMEIETGMEREFERIWLEIADAVASHPANVESWLTRSEEPGVYYIVSDWVDEVGFRAFESSRRHDDHRQKLHPYRTRGSMTAMEIVYHVAADSGFDSFEQWEVAG